MEVGKAFLYSGGAVQWKPPTVRLIPDRPNPFAVAIKATVPTFMAKGQSIKPFGDLIPKITGIEGFAAGLGRLTTDVYGREPLKGFAKFLAYQIQRSKAFKLGQLAKGALRPLLRRLRTFALQLGRAVARKLRALKLVVPPEFHRALAETWPRLAARTSPALRLLADSITRTGPPMPAMRAPIARRTPP